MLSKINYNRKKMVNLIPKKKNPNLKKKNMLIVPEILLSKISINKGLINQTLH